MKNSMIGAQKKKAGNNGRLLQRKTKWNETVIFSVFAAGTLIFMNLRFGLNLTDTNAVPSNTNMDAMKYPPVPATPASSAGGEGGLP
jgi:hypothetical protein